MSTKRLLRFLLNNCGIKFEILNWKFQIQTIFGILCIIYHHVNRFLVFIFVKWSIFRCNHHTHRMKMYIENRHLRVVTYPVHGNTFPEPSKLELLTSYLWPLYPIWLYRSTPSRLIGPSEPAAGRMFRWFLPVDFIADGHETRAAPRMSRINARLEPTRRRRKRKTGNDRRRGRRDRKTNR